MTLPVGGSGDSNGEGLNEFRRLVQGFQPDVVQAGPIVDVGYEISREWDGPLILTSWGFDLMQDVGLSEENSARARAALSGASVLLTDNDAVTERAVLLGMPPEGIVQFPWGIDLAAFTSAGPSLREELNWDASSWVVGCTRRHEPLYDVATVLDGFAEFAEAVPRARLLLVGEGSLSADLKARAVDLGISDRTASLGNISHARLPDAYRTLNTYVSASRVDGTSVSLLEAMACEIPVCVSDIPGNRQWVTPETGLTFPVGNSSALASALRAVAAGVTPGGRQVEDLVRHAGGVVGERADWSVTRTRFPGIAKMAIDRHEAMHS